MGYTQNEKGLTLIELLAALAIFMLICGLFYGALTNVFKTNKGIQQKISAQQEVNHILSAWTNMHQESKGYTISHLNDTTLQLTDNTNTSRKVKLGNNNYQLFVTISYGEKKNHKLVKYPIIPSEKKEIYLKQTNGDTQATSFIFADKKEIPLTGANAKTKVQVELTAVNKENNNDTFTIATTISRMTKAEN
jgi:type II secretory pathway pseudopilin PulG